MSERNYDVLTGAEASSVMGIPVPDDVKVFRPHYKGAGRKGEPFWAICPDGYRWVGTNVGRFCGSVDGLRDKSQNALSNQVNRIFKGEQGSVHGWQFGKDVERFLKIDSEDAKEEIRDLMVAEKENRGSRTIDEWRAHIRSRYIALNERQQKIDEGREDPPLRWSIKDSTAFLKDLAETLGIDWKHIADTRTDAEKAQDAVDRLLSAPESLFEIPSGTLEALERSMDDAVQRVEAYIAERMSKSGLDPGEEEELERGKAKAVRAKRWLDRLRRVLKMREMASQEVPACLRTNDLVRIWALKASYVLRFQCYVGRTGISDGSGVPGVFMIGYPHAKMATDIWLAENRAKVLTDRLLFPGDPVPGYEENRPFEGVPYAGALVMYPPRHGKTEYEAHWAALRINRNKRTQGAYIHARTEEAAKFVKYVSSLFTPDNAAGRRNLSLFPAKLSKRDNNSQSIRLETDDPPSNPNLIGDSVQASAQGNNLDWLIVDDVVSSKDQESPTERARTEKRLKQTWMTRFQGSNGFYVVSGYPWHHDDAIWKFKQDAERSIKTKGREGVCLMMSMMPVGGPKNKFFSIWPEMYPPKRLREIYQNNIRDASVWAANYELNPMTDELRIVKKLRLYDPESEQHKRYLRTCEIHLSLDPAFTNTATSDFAGTVKAGLGMLIEDVEEDGQQWTRSREVIRVLDVRETKATQSELAASVASESMVTKIDYCHVEVNTGGGAVVQMLETVHGITGVIEHRTGPRNKEVRLRRVASMLEDSANGIDAVVEFPGVWEEHNGQNRLVIDPKMRDIYNYIVNFKMSSGFHSLDAMTQLLTYLAPFVGFGEGKLSEQSRAFAKEHGRVGQSILDRMNASEKKHDEFGRMDSGTARWMSGDGFGI